MSQAGPSRGQMMIAAYRAARLSQRPVLQTDLRPAAARMDDLSDVPRGGSAPFQPTGSVFASLMNGQAPIAAEPAPLPVVSPAPPPTLAEMGFGQGMLIRLSQIGLRTATDLANADPADLRAALGDSSRLIDVDAWIARARRAVLGTAGRA